MNCAFTTACVYLLHFVDALGRHTRLRPVSKFSAGHYVGNSLNLPYRLRQHRGRKDAVVIRELFARGHDFRLARVYLVPKDQRVAFEKALKGKCLPRYHCPICRIERELLRLSGLKARLMTPAVKRQITFAERAIRNAEAHLREAQNIAHLIGEPEPEMPGGEKGTIDANSTRNIVRPARA